ncbi:hypothetical protein Mag101_00065 [Microbulbifer agarilyticus]|uniref:DUF2239 domain-containing protein n=1 Tax=Microbulbifer agarilyticus TaxID=260552 RepID=A0A1Q2M0K7_9GAMM|nr:DUF2239 family protein [Microbulbifer agarilyticus]AQQ66223.1 hypothetical protein Mag101_00065 [Microbulbifer agarilyticus]
MKTEYLAIHNGSLIARGDLESVVRKSKSRAAGIEPVVMALDTCKRIEVDWQGDVESAISRLSAPSRRGRPKLGVTSREVTLLPAHWEWLATQRGGASVTLRRLVDAAIKNATAEEQLSIQQNQLYKLLSLFADAPGFEEAARAMYRNSRSGFIVATNSWPADVRGVLLEKFDAFHTPTNRAASEQTDTD